MTDDMLEALEEADAYNRFGGLDEGVFESIAHDHQVDQQELMRRWYDDDRD